VGGGKTGSAPPGTPRAAWAVETSHFVDASLHNQTSTQQSPAPTCDNRPRTRIVCNLEVQSDGTFWK